MMQDTNGTHLSVLPPAVNFHLWKPCNMECGFCFATFVEPEGRHPKGHLDKQSALALVNELARDGGATKLTFAGGEPTLCPWLEDLVRAAKATGLTTMLVTNASRLDALEWIFAPDRPLDWLAVSIDSPSPDTNRSMGRAVKGAPVSTEELIAFCERARSAGIRLKMNTVVTSENRHEDLSPLVAAVLPERWKVLQVLPVRGQNDRRIEDLVVTAREFESFVERHRKSIPDAVALVTEPNDAMRGSYAMVDPAGRFFDNTSGRHRYSEPILDVGLPAAWNQVTFSGSKFEARGGIYAWDSGSLVQLRARKSEPPRIVALTGVSGSGKDTVAGYLIGRGYRRVAIADRIKRGLQVMLGLSEEQLWGSSRNEPLTEFGKTPRQLLQIVSDALVALDSEVWVRLWKREILERSGQGESIICTDVRTKNELAKVRELGALLVRVVRPGIEAPPGSEHRHEAELAEVPDDDFDVVLENSGTLSDLEAFVLQRLLGERS